MPAASTANTKTVTTDLAPHLTAAVLTAILAKPVEALTIAEWKTLSDALKRVASGHAPEKAIGALLL